MRGSESPAPHLAAAAVVVAATSAAAAASEAVSAAAEQDNEDQDDPDAGRVPPTAATTIISAHIFYSILPLRAADKIRSVALYCAVDIRKNAFARWKSIWHILCGGYFSGYRIQFDSRISQRQTG